MTGNRRTEGFTLLEILIAIFILSFGILAVASMQVSSIRGNGMAGRLTEGTQLACDRMEELMSRSYTHSDLTAGTHTDPSPPSGYTVTWNVTDDSPITDTKTVTVTVTWTDHGVQKTATLQQIIPRII